MLEELVLLYVMIKVSVPIIDRESLLIKGVDCAICKPNEIPVVIAPITKVIIFQYFFIKLNFMFLN